jgi:tripartite-type tricarboxylate transporter receptor subunit TctC
MTRNIPVSALALIAVLGFAAPQAVRAQTYPNRPVTIIVPTTAGGGTDIIARIIGDQLSKQLGQAFVIENRPGAGLLVGTAAAATSAPDGYTLLAGLNGNMAVNPSLFDNLPYDPIRDFVPVAMLAAYPFLVVVNKELAAKSIKELIALAKSKPGELNYASSLMCPIAGRSRPTATSSRDEYRCSSTTSPERSVR